MIPYLVSKLAPNLSHLTKGLVKYVSGRGYFRAVPSQNGDKYVISPPPPQSLNWSLAAFLVKCANDRVLLFLQNFSRAPDEGDKSVELHQDGPILSKSEF